MNIEIIIVDNNKFVKFSGQGAKDGKKYSKK